jgi:hypothetical protein
MKGIINSLLDNVIDKYGMKKEDTLEYKLEAFNDSFVKKVKWDPLYTSSYKKNNKDLFINNNENYTTIKIKYIPYITNILYFF